MLAHLPVLGWAKPTPVDPRNFKNPVLDDILTSVVGPISNFVVATGAVLILVIVKTASRPRDEQIVFGTAPGRQALHGYQFVPGAAVPACLYELMFINVVLASSI